jgi:hypothetical protein
MAKHPVLLATAVLALAGATTWALVSNSSKPSGLTPVKLPIEEGGVRVSEIPVGARAVRKTVTALARDWLVESDRLKLAFGADGSSPERRAHLGALLDMTSSKLGDDELRELRTVLSVGGKNVSLQVAEVTVVQDDTVPVVRVRQLSHDNRLELETDYRVQPGSNAVAIKTSVLNVTDELMRSVQIGDRALWPGGPTFAPRAGFVRLASRAEVPWVAREGKTLTYVLSFGKAVFEASFLFDRIGPLGQITLSPPRDLPPGDEMELERELLALPGGLDRAAEHAFRRQGKNIGWVKGRLEPVPTWAVVEARYPDGKPALSVRSDAQGHFQLPLPEGDYRLSMRSPGGEDQEEISVQAGATFESNLLPPRPGMLRYSIVTADGASSPARLSVRGVGSIKDPDFGPLQAAVGAGNVIYSASGDDFIELPEGRYLVTVSRGSEYSLSEHEVDVGEEEGASLRVVLARQVDTSGWLACDFHVHAAPSPDSEVSLEDRITSLLGEGIEFFAATDHDHVTDYTPELERLKLGPQLGVASGVEITTSTWGHFNAFPYPLTAAPPEHPGRDPAQIFAVARARAPGAVIQVNHPRMPGVGYFNRIELDPVTGSSLLADFSFEFDSIELANGYDLENPKVLDDNLREYFALLNSGRRFTLVGNSDSHRLNVNWVGYPRTYVRVADDRPEAAPPADVAHEVKNGHTSVSNGIFILALANGVAGPGDTLSEERVTLQLSVRAPAWSNVRRIEVFANGALHATRDLTERAGVPLRIDWEVDLDLQGDTWLMVVARGDKPLSKVFPTRRVLPFAFTNPIFIDADQDGVFRSINEIPPAAPALEPSARPAAEP